MNDTWEKTTKTGPGSLLSIVMRKERMKTIGLKGAPAAQSILLKEEEAEQPEFQ
jgi:hypothetical protein